MDNIDNNISFETEGMYQKGTKIRGSLKKGPISTKPQTRSRKKGDKASMKKREIKNLKKIFAESGNNTSSQKRSGKHHSKKDHKPRKK